MKMKVHLQNEQSNGEKKGQRQGGLWWKMTGYLGVLALVLTGMQRTVYPALKAAGLRSVFVYYAGVLFLAFAFTALIGMRAHGLFCSLHKTKHLDEKCQRPSAPEKTIVGLVLVWGFLYMLVFPPMSAPDEDAHFAQAYVYSNFLLGKGNPPTEGGMFPNMRLTDIRCLLHTRPGWDDYGSYVQELFRFGSKDMAAQESAKALGGVFWSYLPQTLGITVARLLNLGGIQLMLLARSFNFVFFLFCLWFAIRWMPFGKQLMGVIALFPMTLHLVSSMSYDSVILGLSFLFISKVLELAFAKETVTKKDLVILTVTMMLLAPIKVIYVFMAFLCFLIPKEKFGTNREYWTKAGIMAGSILLTFLLVNIPRLLPYLQESNLELDYTGEITQCYTLKELIRSPLLVIKLMINTVRVYGSEQLVRMVGEKLGWLEITIPMAVVLGFYLLLFYSGMMRTQEISLPGFSKNSRRWGIFVVVSVVFMAYFSMLTAWTQAGSMVIEGVQGRYFLPVLPIAMLMLRTKRVTRAGEELSPSVNYMICLLHIWTLATAFEVILSREGYHVIKGIVVR